MEEDWALQKVLREDWLPMEQMERGKVVWAGALHFSWEYFGRSRDSKSWIPRFLCRISGSLGCRASGRTAQSSGDCHGFSFCFEDFGKLMWLLTGAAHCD